MIQPTVVPLGGSTYAVVGRRVFWHLVPDGVDPVLWEAAVAKLRGLATEDHEAILAAGLDGWRAALTGHKALLDAAMSQMRSERSASLTATTTEAARAQLSAAWDVERKNALAWMARVQGHLGLIKGLLRERDGEPDTSTDALWSRLVALEARVSALASRVG